MASRLPARERLDCYRALISRAVPLIHVMADTAGMHLEVTGPEEPEVICTLPATCPADNRELIRRHIEIPADLIGMLDAAARRDAERRREIQKLKQALEAKGGKPAKDYAAECAIKCTEPAFMRFLIERYDLPHPATVKTAATRVRSVMAITNRCQLDTDPSAAARWREMVKEFENWRKRG